MKGFALFCHNNMEQAEKEMNNRLESQELIRKYLLGNLTDEVRMREMEEKILFEDAFDEELSIGEDELVDEYLDGNLSENEHTQFLQYFLITPERREKLRFIRNLRSLAAKEKIPPVDERIVEKKAFFDWRSLFQPAWIRAAALFLIVGGLGFGIWRIVFYESDIDKGMAQLRRSYRGSRPIESRTTANFDYVPLSDVRGASTPVPVDVTAHKLAEQYLIKATENSASAKAHHALGLFYLADKNIDLALEQFKQALISAPDDAALHNDMGAALLEKANRAESAENFDESTENRALSLKSFNRALEINASLLEALFNKSLALQKMGLVNEARESWQKYLEKDSDSSWAAEARRNLELLKQENGPPKDKSQILQDFLDAFHQRNDARAWEVTSQTKELVTGTMIQLQLVQNFLESVAAEEDGNQSRKEKAADFLSAFLYLGELEKRHSQDPYFADLADYYAKTNQTDRQKLLAAHSALQKGHELITKSDFEKAFETLNQAKELFSAAKSVWEAELVEQRICYCLSRLGKIRESNERLLSLSELCGQKNYKWLQTLSDGWIGSNYSLLGEHSNAVRYDQKALKTAEDISDIYNIQKSLNQLTNEYWLIGDSGKMLLSIHRSLSFSNAYFLSPRQKDRNLLFAAEGLYRFKFYDAAAAFAREEVHLAENELKDKWLSQTAHKHSAFIYGKAQNYSSALQEIETSFALANSFEDETMRKDRTTETRLVLAHLQRDEKDYDKAVENYNQVISEYERSDFSINKYEALKGRLLCLTAQQNDRAVNEEIPKVLKMFDENRQTIAGEAERNIFFDNEQSVYDIATDYTFARLQNSEQAFNYAENSRARSLLSLIKGDSAQPLTLPEIRQKIPHGMQVVYYAMLADKLLIWQISDSKFNTAAKQIRADALSDKVREYTKLLNGRGGSRTLGEELYELLIQPVESFLEPDKSLCIIADKDLFRVPFASLFSPATGKYLVENYALFYAPSATVLVDETEIAARKTPVSNETILSIGNPSFSRPEYPELRDLTGAAHEAREITKLYDPSSKIFLAKDAVKEQIVNNLDGSDVLHFAGHYVANSRTSSLSKFLLASGDLTIEEITRQKLSRVRLMVLSACETGVEKFYNGEGMIGAARAFLAADVPLIVATQWPVDSEATAQLMIKFHRYRKLQQQSTIEALRRAQIDMLTDKEQGYNEPFYWAGFLPIGGYAEY